MNNIRLALAGGGMQGVAHIGAIKALNELGIQPNYISGTSSGSIFASMYAMGYTTEEMLAVVKEYYTELINIEKIPIAKAIGTYLMQKEVKIGGLIKGEKIEELVEKIAKKKRLKI